jgi:uncharacterized protein YkwD
MRAALVFLILFALATSTALAQRSRSSAPGIRAADLERLVRERINDERVNRKLNALGPDPRLSAIARAHSEDMARRSFFSHVNPDGEDPTARGKHAGYECHKEFGRVVREGLSENLYEGSLPRRMEEIVRASVRGWMNSSGHRRNILDKGYDRTGVGAAISGDSIYITQMFC